MSPAARIRFLDRLARLYGIQTAYYDVNDRRRHSSPDALLALLKALGAPVETAGDVENAWHEKRRDIQRQPLEPVSVVREGELPHVEVRLCVREADSRIPCSLRFETGEERSFIWNASDTTPVARYEADGEKYVTKKLPLENNVPHGYHEIILELESGPVEAMLISAPAKAYQPLQTGVRRWGVFLPLYALHGNKSRGAGDYTDLEKLAGWVGEKGGGIVGTLPLLPTFTEREDSSSPYLPVSRLTWNDFYLDIEAVPELNECLQARTLIQSAFYQKTLRQLRDSELVDYRRQSDLNHRVLKEMSNHFFSVESRRLSELREFVSENPVIEDYARFRATIIKQRLYWRKWEQPLRDGTLKEDDYYEEDRNYYLYVQWLAHRQMESAIKNAERKGVQLYLDLPLGVHPDGYDVWHEPGNFIRNVYTGSPPDTVFTRGQNWVFHPPHPRKIREQGYRYIISYLRHHMKQTGILRIDHVMGLHRLFTIPAGFEADQGVYLRYHAEELYAILALESQRNRTVIVGEDLGTVPPYVRPAMNRNGFERMYVLHYELASARDNSLPPVPRNVVASLNTHDMHPFAATWQESDIDHRLELGLITEEEAINERQSRRNIRDILVRLLIRKGWLDTHQPASAAALEACLSFLAASRAHTLLINMEDLWLETQPQNVPSTTTEYPNWKHRTAYALEDFDRVPGMARVLDRINELRRHGNGNR
jgi:4-alpha-glucanotransferase